MVISYIIQRRSSSRYRNICRGYCTDYPRATMSGSMLLNGSRVSFYDGLHGKYCVKCDYPYFKESWQKFPDPSRCPCCGYKMRVRAKGYKSKSDYKDFYRYE